MATMVKEQNNILAEYSNGNYSVRILTDGTKIRFTEENTFVPSFPESIDVKVTNYCDMNCGYCHENSNTLGKHADFKVLLNTIKDLPAGVELAIGGGNPLSHPHLYEFLTALKSKGIIANITVNEGHLNQYKELLSVLISEELVKGIGISIKPNSSLEDIKPFLSLTNNIVFHIICGIHNIDTINNLIGLSKNSKLLFLGYKHFGRGIKYHNEIIDNEIKILYKELPKFIHRCTISFDNLAIEQLNVRRLFTDKGWDRFYMGDDFCFTMYVDAVNQQYAPTSRSDDRKSFNDCSLLDYFNKK